MSKIGTIAGDCSSCSSPGAVKFTADDEAVCSKCGEIFVVEDDSESAEGTPPPPPPPPPAPNPYPQEHLTTAIPPPEPKPKPAPEPELKLNPSALPHTADLIKLSGGEMVADIAPTIQKSRAWRWAYEFKNTGNPYRKGSKNCQIFELFNKPKTFRDAFNAAYDAGMDDGKLSFVLSLYEVVNTCLSAGLLIRDEKGVISICKDMPRPVKIT